MKTFTSQPQTMNPTTLEILFFPAIAFAVSCKPGNTNPQFQVAGDGEGCSKTATDSASKVAGVLENYWDCKRYRQHWLVERVGSVNWNVPFVPTSTEPIDFQALQFREARTL